MGNRQQGFDEAWHAAPEPVRRALALAYEALAAGGLAVGAVLTDATGKPVAEGRNEAYEEGPGTGPLRGTPLAHAEMNALGAARTGWNLGTATLWSTQEPCSMCTAAAEFTGVGRVRYLAPDPWALSSGHGTGSDPYPAADPGGPHWLLAANAMFLRSVAAASDGPGEPRILTHHRAVEPETTAFHDSLPAGLPTATGPEDWLRPHWTRLTELSVARELRTGR
ncbi:nucleoside deaminase [Streptomyces sp. H27-H1]|uniref:nucleoside deaminase n=1 Tax=Streptomyces sp. H27-H1 TaxID=2996461 RepID=UPI00226F5E4E|nr:nucleoside deaminase [Streptomyces sp. H27-H1]MCY0930263.1 nucleoside deaminase [Streptomyces sp. H27-H1]